jgi:hypothetical protein
MSGIHYQGRSNVCYQRRKYVDLQDHGRVTEKLAETWIFKSQKKQTSAFCDGVTRQHKAVLANNASSVKASLSCSNASSNVYPSITNATF